MSECKHENVLGGESVPAYCRDCGADSRDVIATLRARVQELEAGQQWVSVEDKPPPTYTEVWIRGEGFEVLATLEQSNDEPGEEEFDWYPCFFEVGEPLYPTEWRYVTPPPEDKSDE